jgi:hypothetical protein
MINMTNDELTIPAFMKDEVVAIRKALDWNQRILMGERPLTNAARARKAAWNIQARALRAQMAKQNK